MNKEEVIKKIEKNKFIRDGFEQIKVNDIYIMYTKYEIREFLESEYLEFYYNKNLTIIMDIKDLKTISYF